MDGARFDSLTRSLLEARSRRGALSTLLGGTLSLLGLAEMAAKRGKPGNHAHGEGKKGKGKKKKKKKKRGGGPNAADPGTTSPPGACVATCTGKVCGPDGCGGICGDACPTAESCVDGRCACLAGTERCGAGCVVPCNPALRRHPGTCGCCSPSGTLGCTIGATTGCCSGSCFETLPGHPNFCSGKSRGAACQFSAECHDETCTNGTCVCPSGLEECGSTSCVPPCPDGRFNLQNRCTCCRPNGASCAGGCNDCCCAGTGQCVSGVCQGLPNGAACNVAVECETNQCFNHVCGPPPVGP